MKRIVIRQKKCSHAWSLQRQYTDFSWFCCEKCQLRNMIQTYPQTRPSSPEPEQYPNSEDERD